MAMLEVNVTEWKLLNWLLIEQYWKLIKLINWMKCFLHMELSVEGSAAMHFVELLDADFF
jgi:hypothetical protein